MYRFAFTMFCAAFVSTAALAAPCAGFTDVDDSSGFCVNVEWMKNRGITFGLTPTQYDPHSPVTRLQMAAFMYRLGYQNAFLRGGNAFGATAVLGTTDHYPVEIHMGSARVLRIEGAIDGSPNVVAGSRANVVTSGDSATIAGGGGDGTCFAPRLCGNVVNGEAGTIGGGVGNLTTGQGATVVGGYYNTAGPYATVLGGLLNEAAGDRAVAVGGSNNQASGLFSFAAGRSARANFDGCFIWAGGTELNHTSCFAPNEFVARSLGGFYFWTAGNSDATYSGARLAPGTGAWAAYSDGNGKQAISPVDPRNVLEKLVAMPIATWQWKAEPGNVSHMGPTAQDFRAAFGLGDSDKQIVTVDADGVALAAIQGLNSKLEAEVVSLRAELAAIRSLLPQR